MTKKVKTKDKPDTGKITLKDVRVTFCKVFKATSFNDGAPSFSASFLFDPDSKTEKLIQKTMEAVAKEKWPKKDAKKMVSSLAKKARICLRDGDDEDYDGYEDKMYLSSRSGTRPTVLDRDKTPLSEEDGRPYSGCYVNAIVSIWAQDSKDFGKRINAELKGVQFVKDGDSFAGAGTPADVDEFEDLGVDDEDEDEYEDEYEDDEDEDDE